MKYTIVVLLSLTLVLLSCKKEKLDGELAVLAGEWNWSYSVKRTVDLLDFSEVSDTIRAINCEDRYGLNFLEKGIIKAIKNDKVASRKRMVFKWFGPPNALSDRDSNFEITLNNRDEQTFRGSIKGDTIDTDAAFSSLPYLDSRVRNIRTTFRHYYVRD